MNQCDFHIKLTSPPLHMTILYESILTKEPHVVAEYIKLSLKFL